jgi:hypothetical protein
MQLLEHPESIQASPCFSPVKSVFITNKNI